MLLANNEEICHLQCHKYNLNAKNLLKNYFNLDNYAVEILCVVKSAFFNTHNSGKVLLNITKNFYIRKSHKVKKKTKKTTKIFFQNPDSSLQILLHIRIIESLDNLLIKKKDFIDEIFSVFNFLYDVDFIILNVEYCNYAFILWKIFPQ